MNKLVRLNVKNRKEVIYISFPHSKKTIFRLVSFKNRINFIEDNVFYNFPQKAKLIE